MSDDSIRHGIVCHEILCVHSCFDSSVCGAIVECQLGMLVST
jgi:hypothetical protein